MPAQAKSAPPQPNSRPGQPAGHSRRNRRPRRCPPRRSEWPHRPARPDKAEGGRAFKIVSEFEPKGDQPEAIRQLVEGINEHERDQVLLGVTGSGKTFTMAQIIEKTQRPALILAPNKTLASNSRFSIHPASPPNSNPTWA